MPVTMEAKGSKTVIPRSTRNTNSEQGEPSPGVVRQERWNAGARVEGFLTFCWSETIQKTKKLRIGAKKERETRGWWY